MIRLIDVRDACTANSIDASRNDTDSNGLYSQLVSFFSGQSMMQFEKILQEKISNGNCVNTMYSELNNKIIESIEVSISVQNRNQVHVCADIESVGKVHFIISVHSFNQVILYLIVESEFAKAFVESVFDELSFQLERKGIANHIFYVSGDSYRSADGF